MQIDRGDLEGDAETGRGIELADRDLVGASGSYSKTRDREAGPQRSRSLQLKLLQARRYRHLHSAGMKVTPKNHGEGSGDHHERDVALV